ncbi:MAG: InlB B-repeat-containing protein [Sulfuricaulis sp.]
MVLVIRRSHVLPIQCGKTGACAIAAYVLPSAAAVPFHFGIHMDAATIPTANLNIPITNGPNHIHVQDMPATGRASSNNCQEVGVMNFLACKNKIIFCLVLLLFGFNAQAEILLDSSFAGSSPSLNTPWAATDSIDPNLNYSGWNLTWNGNGSDLTGTRPHAVDNVFGFKFCHNFGYPSTLGDALSQKHYIYFTLSPKSGSLNLNNKKIIFGVQRLNDYHAPQKYSVFTSIGGFQAGAEIFTASVSSNGDYAVKIFSFIMPETGYDNITGPIEFRIYAYHTTYCWHPTSLTDFVIQDPAPLYNLSLTGTAGGTVLSDPEGVRFEEGTVVQFKATPESGYHFAGWSGDVTGKGNPRSITMTSDISVTANFSANVNDKMQAGMNLADIVDWASSEAFADAFKMFRPWVTQMVNVPIFDTGMAHEMPLGENGWPAYLPFTDSNGDSQHAASILTEPLAGGVYKVFVDGTGLIRFRGAVPTVTIPLSKATSEPPTEISLSVPVGNSLPLGLNILESDINSPVRNIRIIRPDYQSLPEVPTFQTRYLDLLQPFGALRFVGWGKINILNVGSPIVAWEDRTLKETYVQTRPHGVALEYMVEAANILQRDLWICIPHKADDNYVRQSARLLRDTVGPNQKIYIEYSNETWNYAPHYPQTVYVQDMGQALNLDSNRWTAGQKYVALRSVQIWKIFQEEFGADARVVRVLATHTAPTTTTDLRVAAFNDPTINPDYVMPDVLAIAPYFGHNYTPGEIPPIAPSYPTLDDILNEGGAATASIAEQRSNVQRHKAIADTQGMGLVCYEAGQHFIGTGGAQDDTTLTDILIAANRDPRMYQRYADYLAMLDAEGVSTCTFLGDISRPSKWGSWGTLEYLEQPVSEAPKYLALVDYITDSADLTVAAGAIPAQAYLNDTLTYTFIVTNYGPWDSSNVTFSDTLPIGVAFVSATPQGSCANITGVVTCNLGSLASGASATVTITARATATGTLSHTATVSGSGLDPNPGNNSATATTIVVAPDLVPTAMSASKHGQKVNITDTVQNQGDGTAGAFNVAYYLSTDTNFETGTDIPLASNSSGSGTCARTVTTLVAGDTSSVANMVCYKPSSGTNSGTRYYVLAVDDATNQVVESNEANNVRATGDQVWW